MSISGLELPLGSSLVAAEDDLVARGSDLGLVGRSIGHCRCIGFAGGLRNATLWRICLEFIEDGDDTTVMQKLGERK